MNGATKNGSLYEPLLRPPAAEEASSPARTTPQRAAGDGVRWSSIDTWVLEDGGGGAAAVAFPTTTMDLEEYRMDKLQELQRVPDGGGGAAAVGVPTTTMDLEKYRMDKFQELQRVPADLEGLLRLKQRACINLRRATTKNDIKLCVKAITDVETEIRNSVMAFVGPEEVKTPAQEMLLAWYLFSEPTLVAQADAGGGCKEDHDRKREARGRAPAVWNIEGHSNGHYTVNLMTSRKDDGHELLELLSRCTFNASALSRNYLLKLLGLPPSSEVHFQNVACKSAKDRATGYLLYQYVMKRTRSLNNVADCNQLLHKIDFLSYVRPARDQGEKNKQLGVFNALKAHVRQIRQALHDNAGEKAKRLKKKFQPTNPTARFYGKFVDIDLQSHGRSRVITFFKRWFRGGFFTFTGIFRAVRFIFDTNGDKKPPAGLKRIHLDYHGERMSVHGWNLGKTIVNNLIPFLGIMWFQSDEDELYAMRHLVNRHQIEIAGSNILLGVT